MLCRDTVTTSIHPGGLTNPVLAFVTWTSHSLKGAWKQLPWWCGRLFGGQEKENGLFAWTWR